MKIKKGEFGYIRSQKIKRFIRMLIFWAIDFGIFAVGLKLNHGERRNIYTIIAALGCIPGAMATVSVFMIFRCRSMSEELYREIAAHVGELPVLYENYFTTYEKNLFVDAMVLCGETAVGYTETNLGTRELHFFEEHIRKQLAAAGYRVAVKIFSTGTKKNFLERADQMAARKEELEMERDPLAVQVLQQITL
ncbi:MAG: hypothetical protein Q4B22_01005 [Eubacteriales bacterium]|nr:hypothetical protein [Eubacteriales bacterium]